MSVTLSVIISRAEPLVLQGILQSYRLPCIARCALFSVQWNMNTGYLI